MNSNELKSEIMDKNNKLKNYENSLEDSENSKKSLHNQLNK